MFLISGLLEEKSRRSDGCIEKLSCTAGTMSFVGQSVAARAAYQASQRAHVEWVNGGERGPGPGRHHLQEWLRQLHVVAQAAITW